MKMFIRKIWKVCLAASLCAAVLMVLPLAAFPASALADESVVATAVIPATVTVSGEEGTLDSDIPTETYTFTLTALNNAPMPESDTLTITGAGSASFTVDYTTVGVYQYTLTQDASALSGENSACNDRGNYDSTVYHITVTVQNLEDGSIGVVVAAHRDSEDGEKCDVIFENTYDPVPYTSITVNKTWTDNDQTRPSSVTVNLLDGTEVVETVELKQSNGWSYTWSYLDPYGDHSWDVQEVSVDGYTAEYTTSGDGVITIHNVGDKNPASSEASTTPSEDPTPSETTSPQTGDDAPIALYVTMIVIAAAVAVIGLIIAFRRKKNNKTA